MLIYRTKNETRMNIMNLGEKEKGEEGGGCTSCSSYSCSDTKVTEFVDNHCSSYMYAELYYICAP